VSRGFSRASGQAQERFRCFLSRKWQEVAGPCHAAGWPRKRRRGPVPAGDGTGLNRMDLRRQSKPRAASSARRARDPLSRRAGTRRFDAPALGAGARHA